MCELYRYIHTSQVEFSHHCGELTGGAACHQLTSAASPCGSPLVELCDVMPGSCMRREAAGAVRTLASPLCRTQNALLSLPEDDALAFIRCTRRLAHANWPPKRGMVRILLRNVTPKSGSKSFLGGLEAECWGRRLVYVFNGQGSQEPTSLL